VMLYIYLFIVPGLIFSHSMHFSTCAKFFLIIFLHLFAFCYLNLTNSFDHFNVRQESHAQIFHSPIYVLHATQHIHQ
jgi:hypothetical protein